MIYFLALSLRAIYIMYYSLLFMWREYVKKECYTCKKVLKGSVYFDLWCDESCSRAYMDYHHGEHAAGIRFTPEGCLFVNHIERV